MKDISLNFGVIQESAYRVFANDLINENSNNILKSFIEKIKKSPILEKQNFVFNNFKNCKPFKKERIAERFINQNLNILKNVNWRNIVTENSRLRKEILENYHVESTHGKNNELYNHINTLIESVTRNGYTDIEKSQNSYEFLLEYLTRETTQENTSKEINDNPPFLNWDFVTKLAVNNFNERYSHLNENEKRVFKMLISENDKKINYINDLKKENLNIIRDLLNEKQDANTIKTLEEFRNKLESTDKINQNEYDDYIINFFELNENLKNI